MSKHCQNVTQHSFLIPPGGLQAKPFFPIFEQREQNKTKNYLPILKDLLDTRQRKE